MNGGQRVLGIDFGAKRIGLAVSDPLGYTAQGIQTLLNKGREQILQDLAGICGNYSITEIVVGLPINMNGTFGPKAKEVLDLVSDLEKTLNLPVKTLDERLSSRQAERLMIEEGLSHQKKKLQSDRLAATLLLQSYLESKRQRGPDS